MSLTEAKKWWHCEAPGIWEGEYTRCRVCNEVYGRREISAWGEPYLVSLGGE